MGARENKQLLQEAFAELAKGNGKPFGDLMADDFCWQLIEYFDTQLVTAALQRRLSRPC